MTRIRSLQNLYERRNTTVRGVSIAVGARNCGSVWRAPVTPSTNVVAAVCVLTCHIQAALVRLSMSTSASIWCFSRLNCLPRRKSTVVCVGRRWLPSGSKLIVWLPPTESERLICRVTGGPLSERKLPLTTTSCHGRMYVPVSLNRLGRSEFAAPVTRPFAFIRRFGDVSTLTRSIRFLDRVYPANICQRLDIRLLTVISNPL